jgi:phosphoglycerol transferase MdoB-like AlkP superfamily enzyme
MIPRTYPSIILVINQLAAHLACKFFSPLFLATSYWPLHDSLRCASQVLTLLLHALLFTAAILFAQGKDEHLARSTQAINTT